MSKNIYIVIECTRVRGNSIISKCVRAFENVDAADKFYLASTEEIKDLPGIWFEIQKCELVDD